MTFIYFLLIAEEATSPNEDSPKVPKTFGATDLTNSNVI